MTQRTINEANQPTLFTSQSMGSMTKDLRAPDNHVTGFSDIDDLWVIKIKAYNPLRA